LTFLLDLRFAHKAIIDTEKDANISAQIKNEILYDLCVFVTNVYGIKCLAPILFGG